MLIKVDKFKEKKRDFKVGSAGARWEAAAEFLGSVALQGDAVTKMATMAALCDGMQWDTALKRFKGGAVKTQSDRPLRCVNIVSI